MDAVTGEEIPDYDAPSSRHGHGHGHGRAVIHGVPAESLPAGAAGCARCAEIAQLARFGIGVIERASSGSGSGIGAAADGSGPHAPSEAASYADGRPALGGQQHRSFHASQSQSHTYDAGLPGKGYGHSTSDANQGHPMGMGTGMGVQLSDVPPAQRPVLSQLLSLLSSPSPLELLQTALGQLGSTSQGNSNSNSSGSSIAIASPPPKHAAASTAAAAAAAAVPSLFNFTSAPTPQMMVADADTSPSLSAVGGGPAIPQLHQVLAALSDLRSAALTTNTGAAAASAPSAQAGAGGKRHLAVPADSAATSDADDNSTGVAGDDDDESESDTDPQRPPRPSGGRRGGSGGGGGGSVTAKPAPRTYAEVMQTRSSSSSSGGRNGLGGLSALASLGQSRLQLARAALPPIAAPAAAPSAASAYPQVAEAQALIARQMASQMSLHSIILQRHRQQELTLRGRSGSGSGAGSSYFATRGDVTPNTRHAAEMLAMAPSFGSHPPPPIALMGGAEAGAAGAAGAGGDGRSEQTVIIVQASEVDADMDDAASLATAEHLSRAGPALPMAELVSQLEQLVTDIADPSDGESLAVHDAFSAVKLKRASVKHIPVPVTAPKAASSSHGSTKPESFGFLL
jgi:hypothetical protein